jgi:hypothetical protein
MAAHQSAFHSLAVTFIHLDEDQLTSRQLKEHIDVFFGEYVGS